MLVTMLRCKLHRATVTECDLHYEGSLSLDANLIKASGLLVNERIEVYNINTGARFATYIIEAPAGSDQVGLNGAAARLACVGDRIIICAYAAMTEEEAKAHKPRVIVLDEKNEFECVSSKPLTE